MKKHIIRVLVLSVIVIAAVSCNKNEKEPQMMSPEIKIEKAALEVEHRGGEYRLSYTIENPLDGEILKAIKDVQWIEDIEVNPQEIVLSVEENTSGAERQCTVLLEYQGAESVELTVEQLYNPAEITLSESTSQCDYKGGTFSFTVSVENPVAGMELKAVTKDEWISGLKLEEDKVTFSVPENNSGSSRNGKIDIKYGESSVSHLVVQDYAAAEIKVNASQICEDKEGEYEIPYSIANPREGEKLKASCEAEWIKDLNVADDIISFKVLQNEDSERTAVIELSYITAADVKINVIQEETSYQYTSENLSAEGTANCYIVSASGDYRFKAVKGNGIESVGEISSVEVLWETFGTDVIPQAGDLVKNPRMENNFVEFTVPEPYREGNAVIAAKDAAGKILWSWHVWLTDRPEEQTYSNGAGIFMDRNLGATSSMSGDVEAMGLLYQWGRKDPFLNSCSVAERNEQAKSTLTWPSAESSGYSNGTIEYAVENPTTFIMGNYSNYDWNYTGSSTNDDTRWQSKKTIYDPCPVGYRVPEGGEEGVWARAFGTSSFITITFDKEHAGVDFGSSSGNSAVLTDSPECWYPAAGCRDYQTSLLSGTNTGYYWSCSPDGRMAYDMVIYAYGGVATSYSYNRACGMSVRCVKE